jgi:transposase
MDTELSDRQWEVVLPLIPPRGRMGRPRADDRRVLNGILWVLKTGARWQDLPRRYGHPTTCWRRLRRWQEEGVWQRILEALLATLDAQGRLAWQRGCLDASFAPAKRGEQG